MNKVLGAFASVAMSFLGAVGAAPLAAEELGYGRLLVNDFLGDGHDRWRSGSIVGSHIFGSHWSGELPQSLGEVVELRILGQTLTPANLQSPAAGDRPYAGALSIGAHTHFETPKGLEFALGADLTLVGPQTGLGNFQDWLHDQLSLPGPSDAVLASQVGNNVYFTAVAEAGRNFELGGSTVVRPFAEARIGDETLVRAGFDLTIGSFGQGDLLVRDPVTGQRFSTMADRPQGTSFILGADTAYVDSSVFVPSGSGATLEKARHRVRAGVNWQGKRHSLYYGVTWLSREVSAQSEGQVVGAIRVKINF